MLSLGAIILALAGCEERSEFLRLGDQPCERTLNGRVVAHTPEGWAYRDSKSEGGVRHINIPYEIAIKRIRFCEEAFSHEDNK